MKICIHKSIVGTNRHLVHDSDDNTFLWVPNVPDDVWVVGDSTKVRNIDALAKASGQKIVTAPAAKWVRQFQEIFGDDEEAWRGKVPWPKVLPRSVFQAFVKDVLRTALEAFENPHAISYMKVLQSSREALLQLSRAKVDPIQWGIIRRASSNGQADAINSFRPDAEGFAPPVIYSRSDTTGRITVESGPKILHLKKEYRKVIKSRWNGGHIFQADYVSMEPRILMALVGREPGDDVYEYTSQEVLEGQLTRKETKVVVMGVLYGAGIGRLQSLLGHKVDAAKVMAKVRSHFGVKVLERKLEREFKEKGLILSAYGRVLNPTRTDSAGLVSYHTQATGVDLALQGFNSISQAIRKKDLSIEPIFIVHDAVFLDVHPDVSEYDLREVVEVGSHLPGFETQFPLEVKRVST